MTYKLKKDHILALRTCDKDLKAHGGFQWREKGIVTAPDFKPITECGNGLHALEWGIGDGGLLDWSAEAKWLIVEVKQSDVIQLDGKIKFPSCKVVHCGDQLSATSFLLDVNSTLQGVVGSFVKAGNYGTATAGNYGTATAGNYGTATAGYRGTATAGDEGTATAGTRGTATAGNYGTATAGNYGTATAGDEGTATAGTRGTATAGNYGTATAGNYGTATAGYRGTATAGYRGTATAGNYGTATAGNYGTATAGDEGTATAGYRGTATAGDAGVLIITWWDGGKHRRSIGHVTDGGLEPNVKYRLNDKGEFVKV